MNRFTLLLFVAIFLIGVARADDAKRASFFDASRHMRVSEVKPGMTGYGLSVFKGTKIERFDVEVISIVHNIFSPKCDAILVRLSGQDLDHTGAIAGMSGSPIYLKDEQGRERMCGAFAFGWPLTKDPIGGVQPIEYMLDVNPSETKKPATAPIAREARAEVSVGPARWTAQQSMMLPGMTQPPKNYPFASRTSLLPNPLLGNVDEIARLSPLATPLMTSGMSSKLVEQFTPIFRAYGMMPLEAGGGSASGKERAAKLEPGSVMAVPMLTGDISMTAVGTCTEVLGDYVFGFGHPFNDEGPVNLPMGSGEISTIVPNLQTSFKLGHITKSWGTLHSDESVGVAGKIGDAAKTVPIVIKVKYADGSGERTYNFECASHPKLTPLISTVAIAGAVTGSHELPPYHTLDYDITLHFANGKTVKCLDRAVNAGAGDLFNAIGAPMIAAADNPFEQVQVTKIDGVVTITPDAREATILSANVPRLILRPGETVKAYVTYRPFRAGEIVKPIEFELPKDLSDGTYQLVISDWQQYLTDEQVSKPFRFAAESAEQVFEVIGEIMAVRHDAMYVRLVRNADGVAIGRTAMPNLPSSRRQVFIGAGRSNVTPFVSSSTKRFAMDFVMSGSAAVNLTIDKDARLESAIGKPKHELPTVPRAEPAPKQVIPKDVSPPAPNPPE